MFTRPRLICAAIAAGLALAGVGMASQATTTSDDLAAGSGSGWPSKWTGAELDAGASEVATEKVVIT